MTRIAVISDIHGNAVALDAALADIERAGVDQIVCLGDAIQGGAQPAPTVARLRELACPVVMGNADAWLLSGQVPAARRRPPSRRPCASGRLRSFPRPTAPPSPPSPQQSSFPSRRSADLLCFHGSPTSFDDILLPNSPEEEYERLL